MSYTILIIPRTGDLSLVTVPYNKINNLSEFLDNKYPNIDELSKDVSIITPDETYDQPNMQSLMFISKALLEDNKFYATIPEGTTIITGPAKLYDTPGDGSTDTFESIPKNIIEKIEKLFT